MRRLNTFPSPLSQATISTLLLAFALLAGCGGSNSADDSLDMLLDNTITVFVYDVEAIDGGEVGDSVRDMFEDYWDSSFASIGILMEETESLTVGGRAQDGYSILMGDYDYDYIRDDLDDQGYEDDDYRDYELWTEGSRRVVESVALMEDAGVVVAGDDDAVKAVLRNLSEGESARDGDMESVLRAMDRAGNGWLTVGIDDCDGYPRGCMAVSRSLSVGGSYEAQQTVVVLFRNEDFAESRLDELEDNAEESSAAGYSLESIRQSDEFVVVVSSIDEDDLADRFSIQLGLARW